MLKYSTNRTIPPDGSFGVYDYANYDPAQGPYTGYYAVNEWELRVTVTPTAGTAGPAPTGDLIKITPFHNVRVYATNDSLAVKAEFRMGSSGAGRLTRWFDNTP